MGSRDAPYICYALAHSTEGTQSEAQLRLILHRSPMPHCAKAQSCL